MGNEFLSLPDEEVTFKGFRIRSCRNYPNGRALSIIIEVKNFFRGVPHTFLFPGIVRIRITVKSFAAS
jgi:hypothetical protein